MSSEKVNISISKELYDKIQEYIRKLGGFNSVEEFIEFVLKEVISEEATPMYSKEEEEKIKERLRALGYI